jgi:hypothetical protein
MTIELAGTKLGRGLKLPGELQFAPLSRLAGDASLFHAPSFILFQTLPLYSPPVNLLSCLRILVGALAFEPQSAQRQHRLCQSELEPSPLGYQV